VSKRSLNRLSPLFVARSKDVGLHCDGGGLYLKITLSGSRSWIFRYRLNGNKLRDMGLGSVATVSLLEARQQATELRKALRQGIDPINQREDTLRAKAVAEASRRTFDECAANYIAAHRSGWRNAKHASQWENTLAAYVSPLIGPMAVQDVQTEHIVQILTPIWISKEETARRVRSRIELVLAAATAQGLRVGENPGRWRNHLDKLLPKTVLKVQHHAAMAYADVPNFIARLREDGTVSAQALEFLILTATRTSEVLKARWDEIDLDRALWKIPANRMKAGREHRVPLTSRTLAILESRRTVSNSAYVFSGSQGARHLSNMSMSMLLRRMGFKITVHGFRSSFSSWARAETGHSRDVVEFALAHTIKSKSESPYLRDDLLLKRRALMAEWQSYLHRPKASAEVFAVSNMFEATKVARI
jgi:integrase